ncbi:MAG: DUF922 domain-containing protein [Pseudomonadota bacterium]
MGCKITVSTPKVTTYTVAGDTLKAVWANVEKKGPKDPHDNKKVAALTESKITISDKWDAELRGGKSLTSGQHEHLVGIKNMTITVTGSIKVPKLGSNKLSKAAKKEWERFSKKLLEHEKEHITVTEKVANDLAKEIMALVGTGQGANAKDAFKAGRLDFVKKYQKAFSGKLIEARIAKASVALDKHSKHGAKHGAVLNLDVT